LPHRSQEFTGVAGLAQIAIDPQTGSFAAVAVTSAGRQHDHGQPVELGMFPNVLEQIQPIETGHFQIRKYQIHLIGVL
jgi:hypothetical protein